MLSWEYPPGAAGGMAAHVDGLSRAMASAGHDVVLFTRTNPSCAVDEVVNGVRVVRADVDMPWLRADAEVARAASANHAFVGRSAWLGDWVPDVVHAHDWHVGWAAEVLATMFGVPLVTTLHGTERGRHGGHLPAGEPTDINAVEWWLAFRSSRVITSTRLLVREITGGFELDPDVVRRIPNGIDPSWWRVGARDETVDRIGDNRVRDPATTIGGGATSEGPIVFTWGRVQYEKGFQVLARAMAALRARVPGIVCVIAGRGSYLPELQSQIDLEGVSDIVQLPGFLPDDDLRSAIHRANCVVIPSLYEPFGLVALEALAANAALIVADTGGLAELVGGTGSALMFEPGNAEELADRIEQVLTEPETARAMQRRANELLDATYSWEAIASRTIDVYSEVAASPVSVR